ncbi:MAG: LytR C-terminal domain-containing protein [Solirubrobacterales bacterium]
MELVERIGSFLGIASFFGLAIFALLQFSMARDVRRLREWAGRAPERSSTAVDQAAGAYAEQAAEIRERREHGFGPTRWQRIRAPLLIGLGVLVFGAGAFFAVTALVGEQDASTVDEGRATSQTGSVRSSDIEVAVLNGTSIPGLAANIGETVEENGFGVGPLTNSDEAFDRSVVMYVSGSKPEAEAVARALDIPRTEEMTPAIREVAAQSRVAVIIGSDRSS